MNHNDAIVSITHKSCAALAIQCLADSGITDWQTAFNQQITNAKNLGLMPDDFKVIRETLQNFGLQGVRDALRKGTVPCLEIDCTGLEKMLADGKVDPGSVVSVFITASADELYDRLCKRGTETQEQIQKRLRTAIEESYHLSSYTYVLTNSVLSETVNDLQKAFEGRLPKNVFENVQFRQDVKRILDTI